MEKFSEILNFLIISFFFIISIFLLLLATVISFISTDADTFILIRPLLTLVWLAIIIILFLLYRNYLKNKQIVKNEKLESLKEGGIEEPKIYRELQPDEKDWLTKFHKTSYKIVNNIWWLLPLIVIVDIFFVVWIFNAPSIDYLNKVIEPIFFLSFPIQLLLASLAAKEISLYLDLRSPVFKVQGKVVNLTKTKYGIKFKVKSIGFRVREKDLTVNLINYDEVVVEYSPHTKHIWKIYKTEDI